MKICAKGQFGEFEWTLPEELAKGITEIISHFPEAEQVEVEKSLISDIEKQIEDMISLETVVVAKALLGKVNYAYLVRNFILSTAKEMAKMDVIDNLFP